MASSFCQCSHQSPPAPVKLSKDQELANCYARIHLHDEIIKEANHNYTLIRQMAPGTEKNLCLAEARAFSDTFRARRIKLVYETKELGGDTSSVEGGTTMSVLESAVEREELPDADVDMNSLETKMEESCERMGFLVQELKALERALPKRPAPPKLCEEQENAILDLLMDHLDANDM